MRLDVDAYLGRIFFTGPRQPSPEALAELHLAHLLAVPFENFSIHDGERIQLTTPWLFDKVVVRRRGGFCYELNGLFAELLEALGYSVHRLESRVYGAGGKPGIPFDHLCLRVEAGGIPWLCDVGFGDTFTRPLRLDIDGEQHDGRRTFRITPHGEDRVVEMRAADGSWTPQYRFGAAVHPLSAFEDACRHHQTSPESPFTRKRVCSLLTREGRITLRDERLVETGLDGKMRWRSVPDRAAWERLLEERFGMVVPHIAA